MSINPVKNVRITAKFNSSIIIAPLLTVIVKVSFSNSILGIESSMRVNSMLSMAALVISTRTLLFSTCTIVFPFKTATNLFSPVRTRYMVSIPSAPFPWFLIITRMPSASFLRTYFAPIENSPITVTIETSPTTDTLLLLSITNFTGNNGGL